VSPIDLPFVAVSAHHGLLSCVGGDTGTTGCRESNRFGNLPIVRSSAARVVRGTRLHGGTFAVDKQRIRELRACRYGCAIRLVMYRDTPRYLTALKDYQPGHPPSSSSLPISLEA